MAWCPEMGIGEREIVHLADKLVRGSRLVTLRERFMEKLILHRQDPEALRAIEKRWSLAVRLTETIEAEIGQPLATLLEGAGGQACTTPVAESAELLSGRQKGR